MTRHRRPSVAVALALGLAACGGDEDTGGGSAADPLHRQGEQGALMAELLPPAEGATTGHNTFVIRLMDGEHAPVAGATVTVEPWMPMHGHGSPETSVVTERGDGEYEADVLFNMPGAWELRIAATAGDVADRFVFPLEVR